MTSTVEQVSGELWAGFSPVHVLTEGHLCARHWAGLCGYSREQGRPYLLGADVPLW